MSAVPISNGEIDTDVPIATVLDRLHHEIVVLAGRVDRLQNGLGPVVAASLARRDETIRDMQDLDALSQKLRALAQFMGALGSAVSPKWLIDSAAASQTLLLSEMANRLSGAKPRGEADGGAGELELL